MFKILLLLSLVVVVGCESTPKKYPSHELQSQILKLRDGKLSNKSDSGIVKYDLSDETFRKKLNDFGFRCKIGGRRFKICLDKPGFCRHSTEIYKCGLFNLFRCTNRLEEYIAEGESKLDGSNLRCFSSSTYPILFE